MEPDYLDALAKLLNDARRRKDLITGAAISAAIRQDKQLIQALKVLREIRALPCLDGGVQIICEQENCPRCIARKALERLKKG